MPFPTTSLPPSPPSVSPVPDSPNLATNALSPEPSLSPAAAAATASPTPHDDGHRDTRDHQPIAPASAPADALSRPFSVARSDRPPPSSSSSSSRSINHARRYTLSRFPLLRKGSRELARSPSSSSASKSPADSLFHPTGAPRPSQSIARGPELAAAREPAPSTHRDGDVIPQEATNTSRQSLRLRAQRPDKMHQTSSRLLRMTDDERPYTRVSSIVYYYC